MNYSKAKRAMTKFAALAAFAAASMAVSHSVLGQACPATGCTLPGITVPNGFTTCPGTGTDVHSSFPLSTALCNTQPIAPSTWVFGPGNDLTSAQLAAPFWNPVQTRMQAGLPIVGKRVSTADGYCGVATYDEASNHFTWVDQRYSGLDNSQIWPMWLNNCPGLDNAHTAARGALASSIDEREAQHETDGGAILFFRPVESVRDAQEAVFWTFYPPFGHRSQGSTQTGFYGTLPGTGGYRNSFNRNAVMIAQIGTVAGAQAVSGIAALDGVDGVYLDEQNLAFQSASLAEYNTLANAVRAAAQASNKYLCTVDRTANPNVMTCLLQTRLSAAEVAKREWPLRRLDADGMPFGSIRTASIARSSFAKE